MSTYSPLIVGVFHKEPDAKHAINALRAAGFERHQIGLALREGAVPSLRDDLVKLGVPQDRASYYDHEYQLGNAIVSIRADGREHEAMDILQRYGAYGVQGAVTGADGAPQSTTTGVASAPQGPIQATTGPTGATTGPTGTREIRPGEEHTMKLREEQLQAEKQRVQTGEVRVYKQPVTETKTINVPVTHEEVYLERRPVGEAQAPETQAGVERRPVGEAQVPETQAGVERRPVGEAQVPETPIGQEEIIRVPITEEQVIVTKQPVVTGEVIIGKREVEEQRQYTDTVQREEARLEQEGKTRIRSNENVDAPPVDDKTRARQSQSDEPRRGRKGRSDT